MSNLTKNISRKELRCKCGKCHHTFVDYETVDVVQELCDDFAAVLGVDRVVLHINSAHRCSNHNRAVGGARNSYHLLGAAMDICIDGVTPKELYDYLDLKYPDKYGVGLYETFVHIDSRQEKARW